MTTARVGEKVSARFSYPSFSAPLGGGVRRAAGKPDRYLFVPRRHCGGRGLQKLLLHSCVPTYGRAQGVITHRLFGAHPGCRERIHPLSRGRTGGLPSRRGLDRDVAGGGLASPPGRREDAERPLSPAGYFYRTAISACCNHMPLLYAERRRPFRSRAWAIALEAPRDFRASQSTAGCEES